MATKLVMRRIKKDVYDRIMEEGYIDEFKREELGVGETWDVLARILAHGFMESPQTHALAIMGGRYISGPPGVSTKLLSPDEVAEASELLNVILDRTIEGRHRQLDFTGAQGGDADGTPTISVEDCIRAFRCLRKFYAKAEIHGEAMILLFTTVTSSVEEER
ncbi:DUF1877 family protein [Streptomyces griseoincarnatus]|uniref:YfbM family protein n=1 Tax=Streptomyces griseoincarnatus TaxID=29305 RepID=A0ABT0VW95_STRGI|nr:MULTISPECIES: DUF1877 family protein [Streptomyces]MBJ6613318.1 DUF1877 family protein [Streptomyces sp. I3(2020)]MBJ6623713.1 DUF1877 family protein [Streptomyces sp. I4(2020)]MCM2515622.1 YfbM family protein [Streptomyces griseoincarnatus]